MSLAPNQQLSAYHIVRVLGQGAFGTVYLTHDTLLDRPVAIKELTVIAQTDEVAFQRFLQEARAAGGLNHPNIVTVHALKVVESNVYLVMEYLAGGSLRALLKERGPLPVEEAVRITADVCDGLAAAHAKGIVHRDVKPENILLTEDGRAKVGDFGIAHVPRDAGGTSLTQAGFQPGTLLYMSPEQIRGQLVDERSDVYQVGALLYEMLTQQHCVDMEALERRARGTAGSNVMLFHARLYELLAEAICAGELKGVCRVRPEVPEWVGEAVAAALAKRVEKRPMAEELARALRSGEVVQVDQAISPGVVDIGLAEEHFNRGVAYAEHGRWDEAIWEYRAALRINPNYAEAHHSLGLVYRQQGRVGDAIREAELALQFGFEPARQLLAEPGRVIEGREAREGKAGSAKSEFWLALNRICTDRNLPREVVLEALRDALVFAYRRNFGAPSAQNIRAQINVETGRASIFAERRVVDRVSNPRVEISLEQARGIKLDAQLGDPLMVDITPPNFGRIEAQTAKQVILQRIREAERGGGGVRTDVQHFDQDIACAQQSPLDAGRVFESTQQMDVLGQPRSNPEVGWQKLGTTPGRIGIPPDYEFGIRARSLNDDELAVLTQGLADFGPIQLLDLSHSYITNAGLVHLRELTGLHSLNLWDCRGITDVGLQHLKVLQGLTSLDLSGCDITDWGLRYLKALPNLTDLSLTGCDKITDTGLTHLQALPKLANLHLSGMRITDRGTAELKSLTNLASLELVGTTITDAGVAQLAALTSLRDVWLGGCSRITGAGFAHWGTLTDLASLSLYECDQITDTGLANLGTLNALTSLMLSRCSQITNTGLMHLKAIAALITLDLGDCKQITDEGLAYVGTLTGLTELDLHGCDQITDAGLAHLQSLIRLRSLDLSFCKRITDAGLEHLKAHARFTDLELVGCNQITDTGLVHLQALTHLVSLDLAYCGRITDTGLAHLQSLVGITKLRLMQCYQITDDGLAHLKALTNLTSLDLKDCKGITDAGLARLERPGLNIRR